MGLSPQLITEDLYFMAVAQLKKLNKDNRAAIRLRAIVSAKEHGVNVVAKVFGVTSNTIRSWVKAFKNGGLPDLEYQAGRGRKSKLLDIHYEAIREWIVEDSNLTLEKVVYKLEDQFRIKTSKTAVHRVLQKLKLSYITPRPVHHKQNKESHSEFKKKSSRGDDE